MPDREMLERLQQAKFDDERAHLIQIRNDILWFCNATEGLITQIRSWMHGYAISTLPSVTRITDKSIALWPESSPVIYEISTLSLKKKNVMAELLPLGVYGESGSRGQVSLMIMTSDGQPAKETYILSLDRVTSRWSIRPAGEQPVNAILLNKSAFRMAISALRQIKPRPSNNNTSQ